MSEKDPSSGTREINGVSIRITPSEELHPSKERVNDQRFGKNAKDITSSVGILCDWINLPTLEDSFEDHAERRAWEAALDRPLVQWLDENKIGGNQWGCVHLQFGMLARLVGAHDAELGAHIRDLTKDVNSIVARLVKYKDEGSAAREAYLEAIEDLDAMARAVVNAITA